MYWPNYNCAGINCNFVTDGGCTMVSTSPLAKRNILEKYAAITDYCSRMHYQAMSMHNNQTRSDRGARRDVYTENDPIYCRNNHGHHRMSTSIKRIRDAVQTHRMPLKRTETSD